MDPNAHEGDSPMIDHPLRGRLVAWGFAALDAYMQRKYADIKPGLLAQAPAVVVELGPGAGANLRYLPRGTHLIAIEPNRYMHAKLRRRAAQHGIDLDLRGLPAEHLDLPSACVDLVFTSHVLCSVDQPRQVLAEVRRILRPGGRFACVEHVAAPDGSAVRKLQRLLQPAWKWAFERCDLCRDTGAMLRTSGFARVEVRPLVLPTVVVPIRHQIVAVCIN
jgi:SAM-dependent methyltransferase